MRQRLLSGLLSALLAVTLIPQAIAAPAPLKPDSPQRCTAEARKKFVTLGWASMPRTSFTDHYNPTLNKCFMVIESTTTLGNDLSVFKTLINVSDDKQFGLWAKLGNGSDETAAVRCTVTMLSGEEEPCFTEEQFRLLIKRYMQ